MLKYFILLFFISGCAENTNQPSQDALPLYPEPLTFSLDTSQGYTINKITGDTIEPLVNSFGDTVKTGISLSFNSVAADPVKVAKPTITKLVTPAAIIIKSNVHPVPENRSIIPVDTAQLTKIKLGEGDQTSVLRNSNGVISTGIPIPVTGKKMPFRETHPVKALSLRFKDAATANVQYLDVDQGMSSSFVYVVLEDKNGNLWFGMDGTGICKYDGVSFTNYTTREGLSDNTVYTMLEDRKGNIWTGTSAGLNKFDGKNFTQYTQKEGLPGNRIFSMLEDKKGDIWISTSGGGITNYDGKNFTHYSSKEGLPNDTVFTCLEDRKGNLWFGTAHGAAKFNGNTFTHYTRKDSLMNESVSSMLEDRSGNIWFGSNYGLCAFDGNNFIYYSERDGLSANNVWSILQDRNGNIWIGTTFGGINKYDGKNFTQYNLAEGLSNNKVRAIMEDRSGNIWFGTDGGGINKLNVAGFSYLPPNQIFENNRIRPIIRDQKGNTWFGTEGAGLGKYQTKTSAAAPGTVTYYTAKNGFQYKGQRSLLEDTKGNIWIGTIDGGMCKYDGTYFTDYSVTEAQFPNTVFAILEDKSGSIWFGKNDDGISKYNGTSFSYYTEKEGLPAKKFFSILEDKKGNLWFGTDGGGLCKYDGTHLVNYTEKEGLFNKSITSIIEDEKGILWLGTLGAGVCRFDGKQFTYCTEKEGLSNNYVWSLIRDAAGNIWAGTDKGLNRLILSGDRYVIYQYGLQDGLKAIDFNLHSACIDNNNRIWWGTGKNIVIKDLNFPFKTDDVRSVQLSYIEINDRFYDYHNFPDSSRKKIDFSDVIPFSNYPEGLRLSHDQNHLSFHFSAIDWAAPDKIKYSYRMIGVDEKWSSPSFEAVAEYRSLQHGKYELQVKAIGQSQVWTEPIRYSFTIRPPWWLTWWFKSIIAFVSLALIFFTIRFIYLFQLRKQKALLEKRLAVQYERQRISAEMHDDIGAGLSGIKLMTEMAKKKSKDEKSIAEIEKIYESVGDVSAKMKEVIWSLNTENDSLNSLISYLQRQARMMMENYPGKFSMTMPDNIPDVQINGDARRYIYLLVKEALHNIIKHSGADKVDVTITCDDILRIVVSDNGKGMNPDQNNDGGNGMKNMRQRMQQLGGVFFIKNKEGLTLTFEIPLKPAL